MRVFMGEVVVNNLVGKETDVLIKCLTKFVDGFKEVGIGDSSTYDTDRETVFVSKVLGIIPAYVDAWFKGDRKYVSVDTLLLNDKVFTLSGQIGYVRVLIEYNIDGKSEAYGCTFTNILNKESIYMSVIDGVFSTDIKGNIEMVREAVNDKIYMIFD